MSITETSVPLMTLLLEFIDAHYCYIIMDHLQCEHVANAHP